MMSSPSAVLPWKFRLDDIVALAPAKKGFGADGVMVNGGTGAPGFGARDQKTVHVALAESGKRSVLGFCPADEATDLDFIVVLGLEGAGGLQVKPELMGGLLPGESR